MFKDNKVDTAGSESIDTNIIFHLSSTLKLIYVCRIFYLGYFL